MNTLVSTAANQLPAAPPAPDELRRGAKAGPWIVEYVLGSGGMGAVYAVVHEAIGKRAALKVLHRWLLAAATVERIFFEARVVNRVGHPNIVDIFETGTLADGRPYIVMERLDGAVLGQRVYAAKLAPHRVIAILLQICDALDAAHAAGIVHRNLKLDNVFVLGEPDDPNPRVKLLDWGIAKELSSDVHHTIDGQLVGTPQYLAPEQARGGKVSAATDVYSLGVMAYELFVDHLPFEAETPAEIMTMHLRTPPPSPREVWPEMPVGLEQLLLAMLAKAPEARPTVNTVARTLEIIRGELDDRDSREVIPPCTRWASAPALSIPPPARWRAGTTRWQVAIGVAALVVSAAMFGLSRAGDTAVAAARPAPMTQTARVVEPIAISAATTAAPHGEPVLQPIAQPPPHDQARAPAPEPPIVVPLHLAPAKPHAHPRPRPIVLQAAACTASVPKPTPQLAVKLRKAR